jgi:large subunit ribosomal protein L29
MRALNDQELEKELENSYKELQNLRFRIATKQLANTSQIRNVKKNVARLNTIIRERKYLEGR